MWRTLLCDHGFEVLKKYVPGQVSFHGQTENVGGVGYLLGKTCPCGLLKWGYGAWKQLQMTTDDPGTTQTLGVSAATAQPPSPMRSKIRI